MENAKWQRTPFQTLTTAREYASKEGLEPTKIDQHPSGLWYFRTNNGLIVAQGAGGPVKQLQEEIVIKPVVRYLGGLWVQSNKYKNLRDVLDHLPEEHQHDWVLLVRTENTETDYLFTNEGKLLVRSFKR